MVSSAAMNPAATSQDTQRSIDAVWRIESPRLIGGLLRILRDVGEAEDAAQDALVAALEHWPKTGVPDNPGAWLMATAKKPCDRSSASQSVAAAQVRGSG